MIKRKESEEQLLKLLGTINAKYKDAINPMGNSELMQDQKEV